MSGTGLDVKSIEQQLMALWQQEGEHNGVLRTSTVNLLVYIPGSRKTREVDEVVSDITLAHPARVILLLVDSDSTSRSVTAEVNSHCTLPSFSNKQVCCEEISILASAALAGEIPSAVSPLLLADLPVYLWWRAVPKLEDRLFKRLAELSDRVIIDSSDFADPRGDLKSLARIIGQRPRRTAFSDLNWARLGAWRGLLASFYDVTEYRPLISRLKRVVIEYAPGLGDGQEIAARPLLLAGWLASRLGWQLEAATVARAGGALSFEFLSGDQPMRIEFSPTPREIEPGHLALVKLESAADPAPSFSVRRSQDAQRIEAEVTGAERCSRRVLSYESWTESALIGRELELSGRDSVYEQSVLAAARFLDLLEPEQG